MSKPKVRPEAALPRSWIRISPDDFILTYHGRKPKTPLPTYAIILPAKPRGFFALTPVIPPEAVAPDFVHHFTLALRRYIRARLATMKSWLDLPSDVHNTFHHLMKDYGVRSTLPPPSPIPPDPETAARDRWLEAYGHFRNLIRCRSMALGPIEYEESDELFIVLNTVIKQELRMHLPIRLPEIVPLDAHEPPG